MNTYRKHLYLKHEYLKELTRTNKYKQYARTPNKASTTTTKQTATPVSIHKAMYQYSKHHHYNKMNKSYTRKQTIATAALILREVFLKEMGL